MLTVMETPVFLKQAGTIFSEEGRFELVEYLAANPDTGDIIPGTGGVRKLRFAASGRGKRGGARVIYFYFDDSVPLVLLGVYPKNRTSDLSPDAKKMLTRIVRSIKSDVRKQNG